MGRFISADDRIVDNGNMFTYCNNNPVNQTDFDGHWPKLFNKIAVKIKNSIKKAINFIAARTSNSKNKPSSGDRSLPEKGKPKEKVKSPDGVYERGFGPDGEKAQDKHNTDHGHPKHHPNPHGHDWVDDENGNKTLGPAYPWDGWKINFNSDAIIGTGIIIGSVVLIGVVALDDLTGIGIGDNFLIPGLIGAFSKGVVMVGGM